MPFLLLDAVIALLGLLLRPNRWPTGLEEVVRRIAVARAEIRSTELLAQLVDTHHESWYADDYSGIATSCR